MFLGLRTVIYHAPDLAKAKTWYAAALGVAPYFDEPFYVGFEIAGFELGLDPDVNSVNVGNKAVAYWGVSDIEQVYGLCSLYHADATHVFVQLCCPCRSELRRDCVEKVAPITRRRAVVDTRPTAYAGCVRR